MQFLSYIRIHDIRFSLVNLDLNRDNESDALVSVPSSFHNLNEQGKNDDLKASVLE